jgi:hypothetical protein
VLNTIDEKKITIAVFILALAVRLFIAPFLTYDFDLEHWGETISNIRLGDGLYGLSGYYYSPVWGYILGLLSSILSLIGAVPSFGTADPSLIALVGMHSSIHTWIVPSFELAMACKLLLIVSDMAVGALLFHLVKRRTGSVCKANIAAAIWLFCPVVIYMSSIGVQFDTISALLLLLAVAEAEDDRCFLAGSLLAAASLTKLFPVFAAFVLAGYILSKHRGDGLGKRKLTEGVCGFFFSALVLLIPVIVGEGYENVFVFATSRVDSMGFRGAATLLAAAAMVLFMAAVGHAAYRAKDPELGLYGGVAVMMLTSVMVATTPQYVIVAVPFVAALTACCEKNRWAYWLGLALIGLGPLLNEIGTQSASLLAMWCSWNGQSTGWIIDFMNGPMMSDMLGQPLYWWLLHTGIHLEFAGLILLDLLILFERYKGLFEKHLHRKEGGEAVEN